MEVFLGAAMCIPRQKWGVERCWLSSTLTGLMQPNRARVPADFDPLGEFAAEPADPAPRAAAPPKSRPEPAHPPALPAARRGWQAGAWAVTLVQTPVVVLW